jgi:hypothetical protein
MGPSPFSFAALWSRGFPCSKGQENYRANANRFQKKHPVISLSPLCFGVALPCLEAVYLFAGFWVVGRIALPLRSAMSKL